MMGRTLHFSIFSFRPLFFLLFSNKRSLTFVVNVVCPSRAVKKVKRRKMIFRTLELIVISVYYITVIYHDLQSFDLNSEYSREIETIER